MNETQIQNGRTTYTRISKTKARKLWKEGTSFYIVSKKMGPGGPWNLGYLLDPSRIKKERRVTSIYPTVEVLFDAIVAEYVFNNWRSETGYFAAFYSIKENTCSKCFQKLGSEDFPNMCRSCGEDEMVVS